MFSINKFFFIILIFIVSCQPLEILEPINFDNSNLDKISINAKEVIINNKYISIFSDINIEDQIKTPPVSKLTDWLKENLEYFGDQNILIVNILEASLIKKEIKNQDKKKYAESTIFLYEIHFLVDYEIIDDSGYLLANATVESSRSTTSQKYISLNESEIIINELLFNSLVDFTEETELTIKKYMGEYSN